MQLRLVTGQLVLELLEFALRGGAPPPIVDDGISKHTIKPGDRRLAIVDLLELGGAACEGLLQDVFGQRAISEPPLQEAQKLMAFRYQALE